MASVIISGDTSGSVTLSAPATAGSNTIVLPSGSGTLTLPTGTATITANGLNSNIVSATSQTASGTSISFTGIPSWAKRITVILNAVSVNGSTTPAMNIQIGSGSLTTTGYSSLGTAIATNGFHTSSTTGFVIRGSGSAAVFSGTMTLVLLSGNTWVSNHTVSIPAGNTSFLGGGVLALSGTLDRLAIVTTDTMNGGSFNILYE
jgi:hypothetical protein